MLNPTVPAGWGDGLTSRRGRAVLAVYHLGVSNILDRLRGVVEEAGLSWPEMAGPRIQEFESQVVVDERDGTAEDTRVQIDHLLPKSPQSRTGQLRFTTRAQYLSPKRFGPAATTVNSASGDRRRRIFCIDMEDRSVISAVAYHIDRKRLPVLVTAFAVLPAGDPSHEVSLATAVVLKAYLHVGPLRLAIPGA